MPSGGARPGAGRPKKPPDAAKTPGKKPAAKKPPAKKPASAARKPKPSSAIVVKTPDFYSDGQTWESIPLKAADAHKHFTEWLGNRGCLEMVSPFLIEQYVTSVARAVQCESVLSKKPGPVEFNVNSGTNVISPYAKLALEYRKSADRALAQIYQVIRDAGFTEALEAPENTIALLMQGAPSWRP